MARGILLMGASGVGKTTLGKMVASRIGKEYFDIDDFIYRNDTLVPYTKMYTHDEKINNLKNAISKVDYFVMGGSMSGFHEHFDHLFDLVIFLKASTEVRKERVQKRAEERYGRRVKGGGDMYLNHKKMIKNIVSYDTDGSPNLEEQTKWFNSFKCRKIKLDGEDELSINLDKILNEYNQIKKC